jgi:putative glutamine amidotransferase
MQPVIGITASPRVDAQPHGAFPFWVLNEGYADAVTAAGGVPVILPSVPGSADALLDRLDGVLFSGGADVDPARYGAAEVHPSTYGIDPRRDAFELELTERAVARAVPVLGICRGIQVINVALGGSLIQDIGPASRPDAPFDHRQHEAGLAAHEIGHEARMADHPVLRGVFGAATVGVNSFHHQVLDRVAPALEPVAWSPDGMVEAVVGAGNGFLLGVQWHPELMFRHHPDQLAPFRALVAAARERMASPVR